MRLSKIMQKMTLCGLATLLVFSEIAADQKGGINQLATDFTGVAKAAIPGVV